MVKRQCFNDSMFLLLRKCNGIGSEHYICRKERGKLLDMIIKNGVGYKNGICKGQFMLVTFFLSGAYLKQITQIFHGIQGSKLLRKIGFIFCVF